MRHNIFERCYLPLSDLFASFFKKIVEGLWFLMKVQNFVALPAATVNALALLACVYRCFCHANCIHISGIHSVSFTIEDVAAQSYPFVCSTEFSAKIQRYCLRGLQIRLCYKSGYALLLRPYKKRNHKGAPQFFHHFPLIYRYILDGL